MGISIEGGSSVCDCAADKRAGATWDAEALEVGTHARCVQRACAFVR